MHRLAIAIAAVFLLSGCFVLDELEKGEAIIDAHSPNRKKRMKEEEEALAKTEAEKQPSASQQMAKWWDNARSIGPRPDDKPDADPMVSCTIAGGVRFTRRSDCLAGGGRLP
jgi:hypothetical protein